MSECGTHSQSSSDYALRVALETFGEADQSDAGTVRVSNASAIVRNIRVLEASASATTLRDAPVSHIGNLAGRV